MRGLILQRIEHHQQLRWIGPLSALAEKVARHRIHLEPQRVVALHELFDLPFENLASARHAAFSCWSKVSLGVLGIIIIGCGCVDKREHSHSSYRYTRLEQ